MNQSGTSRRQNLQISACLLAGLFSTHLPAFGKNDANVGGLFLTDPSSIKDSLVRIFDEDNFGIGFITEIDGKQYIVTNASVISGHNKLQFKTLSGTLVRPAKIELSATRDLARLQVMDQQALKFIPAMPENETVAVLNYLTSSKIKTESGIITGSTKDMIELNAPFDESSSGSPMLNTELAVGGVASHLVYYKPEGKNWNSTPRQFAYKLDGASWYSTNWKNYNSTYGKNLRAIDQFRDQLYLLAGEWMRNPKQKIEFEGNLGLGIERWIKQHNGLLSDLDKKQSKGSKNSADEKIGNAFQGNCKSLIQVCMSKVEHLKFISQDKKITPYLRMQFTWRALELKKFCTFIKKHARDMENFRWR